jgi:hypothetical protein
MKRGRPELLSFTGFAWLSTKIVRTKNQQLTGTGEKTLREGQVARAQGLSRGIPDCPSLVVAVGLGTKLGTVSGLNPYSETNSLGTPGTP